MVQCFVEKVGCKNESKRICRKRNIILSAILAVVFGVAITRVTFAYESVTQTDTIASEKEHVLKIAAEYYAKMHPEEMKEEENYIFGSDLIEAGYLFDTEDKEKENAKIKITKENNTYHAEVVK